MSAAAQQVVEATSASRFLSSELSLSQAGLRSYMILIIVVVIYLTCFQNVHLDKTYWGSWYKVLDMGV